MYVDSLCVILVDTTTNINDHASKVCNRLDTQEQVAHCVFQSTLEKSRQTGKDWNRVRQGAENKQINTAWTADGARRGY